MSVPNINPNHAYAVTAGVYGVGSLVQLDTILHLLASIVVIVSGAIALWRSRTPKK